MPSKPSGDNADVAENITYPCDDDGERYAFIAGCLKRDNPFLITLEVEESARNVPPIFTEKIPEWAGNVAPLKDTLCS
ncbi:hypothetical protein VCV18_007270 [Metarhizium anisopliae]